MREAIKPSIWKPIEQAPEEGGGGGIDPSLVPPSSSNHFYFIVYLDSGGDGPAQSESSATDFTV